MLTPPPYVLHVVLHVVVTDLWWAKVNTRQNPEKTDTHTHTCILNRMGCIEKRDPDYPVS